MPSQPNQMSIFNLRVRFDVKCIHGGIVDEILINLVFQNKENYGILSALLMQTVQNIRTNNDKNAKAKNNIACIWHYHSIYERCHCLSVVDIQFAAWVNFFKEHLEKHQWNYQPQNRSTVWFMTIWIMLQGSLSFKFQIFSD